MSADFKLIDNRVNHSLFTLEFKSYIPDSIVAL